VKGFLAMIAREDNSECCVICILSHGAEGCIYGTDHEKVAIDFVIGEMDKCEKLKGKPKMLIFQACRGSELQHNWNDFK
jgi:hypothetical protein